MNSTQGREAQNITDKLKNIVNAVTGRNFTVDEEVKVKRELSVLKKNFEEYTEKWGAYGFNDQFARDYHSTPVSL